jgi:hypothetical protein
VIIPPPEDLGVGLGTAPQPVDLARVWARLKAMGAVGFEVNRFGQGWKFVCLLPGTNPDRPRRIEAHAGTEAEAIRNGLARAEQAHAVLAARK